MFKAEVYITFKEGVLDPQGNAVQKALHALEYTEVEEVTVGRYMELLIEGSSREKVKKRVEEMCGRLLANPVIEEYTYDVTEV